MLSAFLNEVFSAIIAKRHRGKRKEEIGKRKEDQKIK
jgi:hypothetical protein